VIVLGERHLRQLSTSYSVDDIEMDDPSAVVREQPQRRTEFGQ